MTENQTPSAAVGAQNLNAPAAQSGNPSVANTASTQAGRAPTKEQAARRTDKDDGKRSSLVHPPGRFDVPVENSNRTVSERDAADADKRAAEGELPEATRKEMEAGRKALGGGSLSTQDKSPEVFRGAASPTETGPVKTSE
jgi:hypothetical protein